MRKLAPALLLAFLSLNCYAQDKPVVISQKIFNPYLDFVTIGRLDGWYFRAGNDTAWAAADINMSGWQKLTPTGLTAKYARKNGRVEGWFRIKIKLDSTVKVKGLKIAYDSYAPADIFINGKLLGSYGSTGLYRRPYAEYDANVFNTRLPLDLKQGEQFTLALHIVDSLTRIVPVKLRSEWKNQADIIAICGDDNDRLALTNMLGFSKSYSIWLSVSFTLCVLFWLLALQNRRERVLLLIAYCSTFFVGSVYVLSARLVLQHPSSSTFIVYDFLANFSLGLFLASVPMVIAEVFKRRILLWVKVTLVVIAFYAGAGSYLPSSISNIIQNAPLLFPLVVSLYYIISSWKKLRGSQWSVVAGILGSILFFVTLIVVGMLWPGKIFIDVGIGYYIFTGFLLCFPVSMLVYVAMRFKEIIKEVRHNAAQVVQLSEEKKQEALNRQKLLEEEVNRQTAEIRANQARLIQSEKMASLGELTAGIAHEIQNPLNFVNNFSDVSIELLEELKQEEEKGNKEDVIAIADDLTQNLEKIRHHGKRADAIVKGMLQHSRASSGQKELTDVNVLAEEYLRLAYHGLRAKDKDFNAELITHLDAKLPKVEAVPQDIGRVLLNVINNAFYAVQQKSKTAGNSYKPTVEVSTTQQNGSVVISVKDNGTGIPDHIKEKIMQPFFTTKPTGEGTGLGLSLSYDIVVKGHGGSITIDTKEGEGSEFTVSIPI
ncbi:MAG TPA: ATP-binding protein [Mucilaginibacter sp.]|nr:ATP-binding protein [Mucilaginibacter sp.]